MKLNRPFIEIKKDKDGRNFICLQKEKSEPKISGKIISEKDNVIYSITKDKNICCIKENDDKKEKILKLVKNNNPEIYIK